MTAADVVVIDASDGESSDSAGYLATGAVTGAALGQDAINGFDSSYDTVKIVATTGGFDHSADLSVGTGTGLTGEAAAAAGAVGYYATNTLLVNTDDAAETFAGAGDIVITFSNFKAAGVDQLDAENVLTKADVSGNIQYNLTGTTDANTFVGGDLADTIDGAGGADVITGGAGNDTIIQSATASAMTVVGGDGTDTLSITTATAVTISSSTTMETLDLGEAAVELTITAAAFEDYATISDAETTDVIYRTLISGATSDTVTKTAAADVFVIADGESGLTITDLTTNVDKIDVNLVLDSGEMGDAEAWAENGTATDNAIVTYSGSADALSGAEAAGLFEAAESGAAMVLAAGEQAIFFVEDSAEDADGFDGQVFLIDNTGGTITGTLIVTVGTMTIDAADFVAG
jgi:hypothetical protein